MIEQGRKIYKVECVSDKEISLTDGIITSTKIFKNETNTLGDEWIVAECLIDGKAHNPIFRDGKDWSLAIFGYGRNVYEIYFTADEDKAKEFYSKRINNLKSEE